MPQTVIKDQTPLNCKKKFQNSAISWVFDPIERCLVCKVTPTKKLKIKFTDGLISKIKLMSTFNIQCDNIT